MSRLGAAKKRARQRLRPVVLRSEPTPESYAGGLAAAEEVIDERRRALAWLFLGVGGLAFVPPILAGLFLAAAWLVDALAGGQ